MGSTENEAGEGMPRAKDGKKDKKERAKQKREKGSIDTEESAQIDGKEVVNEREVLEENEAGEGMARANDGTKDEKKRKKQKRQKGSGDTEEVSAQIDGNEIVNEREVLEENEAREGMARAKDRKQDEKMSKKQKRQKGSGDMEEVSAQIGGEEVVHEREVLEENSMEKVAKNGGSMDSTENEAGEGMPRSKDEKKRKKRKRERDEVISGGIDGKEDRNGREMLEENIQENVEPSRKKKKKKKKKNQKTDLGNGEMKDNIAAANYSNEVEEKKKKKKKKKVEPEKTSSKETSKRVSFSEDVQIFPSSDDPNEEGSVQKAELVRGKRFSPEEDEMVKEAVLNYIHTHELGEEGLEKVLKCKNYPEVRNCWKEIGEALPWRPYGSVYHRAHILFEKDDNSKWTEEELELLRKFHEKHGPDWKALGDALGKHRLHVKDAWRRINVANKKTGQWSQDEYQNLFDLVNMDLRMKAFEERKSKHGMLRDNICWTAISSKLGTRATHICCTKWYDNLASPMVTEGEWLEVDDYHLVIALYGRDECCMEDVDWDSLLEHRPGDVCRKRWNQMVKHLGELKNGSFAEQVEVLMNRYCPDVLEAREAYYSKPIVD